jgi:signal peptidase I
MTKKKTAAGKQPSETQSGPAPAGKDAAPEKNKEVEETPYEAVASICSVLVVGLFILTFLAQNFVIPSGSMEKTLLVGDHLVVDRITIAPPTWWMPLVRYREPRRGDVVVFIKPSPEPQLDSEGKPQYFFLVKRLIAVPGDRLRLNDGIVSINGVAQPLPKDGSNLPMDTVDREFLDDFPSIPPAMAPSGGATEAWSLDFPKYAKDGDLVVPQGMYFMMGDNRHNSLDSRYWGFVPRANIVGRPLFNYWSFITSEDQYEQTGLGNHLSSMLHIVTHFFSDTRWSRTFHVVR